MKNNFESKGKKRKKKTGASMCPKWTLNLVLLSMSQVPDNSLYE